VTLDTTHVGVLAHEPLQARWRPNSNTRPGPARGRIARRPVQLRRPHRVRRARGQDQRQLDPDASIEQLTFESKQGRRGDSGEPSRVSVEQTELLEGLRNNPDERRTRAFMSRARISLAPPMRPGRRPCLTIKRRLVLAAGRSVPAGS
jgi:hypothetical protein